MFARSKSNICMESMTLSETDAATLRHHTMGMWAGFYFPVLCVHTPPGSPWSVGQCACAGKQ